MKTIGIALVVLLISATAEAKKISAISVGACEGGDLTTSSHLVITFNSSDNGAGQTFIKVFVDGRGAGRFLVGDARNIFCLRGIREGGNHKLHIETYFRTGDIYKRYAYKLAYRSGGTDYTTGFNAIFQVLPNMSSELELNANNMSHMDEKISEGEQDLSESIARWQCDQEMWEKIWCDSTFPPPPSAVQTPAPEIASINESSFDDYRSRSREMLQILGRNSLLNLYLSSPRLSEAVPYSIRVAIENGDPTPEAIAWARETLSQLSVPEVNQMCSISFSVGVQAAVVFAVEVLVPYRKLGTLLGFVADYLIGVGADRLKDKLVEDICTRYRHVNYGGLFD